MRVDPYRLSGGTMIPQSWNRYSYVHNDPINAIDPVGLNRSGIAVYCYMGVGGGNGDPLFFQRNCYLFSDPFARTQGGFIESGGWSWESPDATRDRADKFFKQNKNCAKHFKDQNLHDAVLSKAQSVSLLSMTASWTDYLTTSFRDINFRAAGDYYMDQMIGMYLGPNSFSNGLLALTDYGSQRIILSWVYESLSSAERNATFVHELLHTMVSAGGHPAITNALGLKDKDGKAFNDSIESHLRAQTLLHFFLNGDCKETQYTDDMRERLKK